MKVPVALNCCNVPKVWRIEGNVWLLGMILLAQSIWCGTYLKSLCSGASTVNRFGKISLSNSITSSKLGALSSC